MRKIILILLLLFITSPAYPFTSAIQGVVSSGGASGGCACATARDTCTGSDTTNVPFCYYADRISLSQQFTAGATAKICKATIRIRKDGNTGNNPSLTAYIYTDSTNVPGTVVGTGSTNSVTANGLTTSYADVEFTGISADISSGTKYHLVLMSSAQCTTDLLRAGLVDTGCGVDTHYWAAATIDPTWTAQNTTYGLEYALTSCE